MSNPEPCNQEIYEKGTVVIVIAGPSREIEEYVVSMREKTQQPRIDWHYVAGRGMVKALGDIELIRKTMLENPPNLQHMF